MHLTEKQKSTWFWMITGLFILANCLAIAFEFFWLPILPVFLMILLLLFFRLEYVIMLIIFCTPLAINLRDYDIGLGVSLPTEPLMAAVLLIFIFKWLYENPLDSKLIRHPVTIAILFNLIWIFITSITSQIPLVSFKFLLARLWFIIPFYFITSHLFKHYKYIKPFVWLYVIPLLGVIAYASLGLISHGFDEQVAHWIMSPFYNDHTAYGAALAIFIPPVAAFAFYPNYNRTIRFFAFGVLVILNIALIFSISRAAWISVVAAIGVLIILWLKIKMKWVFATLGFLIIIFFSFRTEIVNHLAKNKQDSSADLAEHVKSISNITSDASNLERINRWQSAFRMFAEKPFWGWGPGTYQFEYAPFQSSLEKTIISTNAGDKGNAHSEYIGPLAESGILGLLSFLAILISVSWTALRVRKTAQSKRVRYLVTALWLGLVTYFIHGFLNNFLDTDKASVPFWGFTAAIVALDIYHRNKKDREFLVSDNESESNITTETRL